MLRSHQPSRKAFMTHTTGRELWQRLHAHADSYDPSKRLETLNWLASWGREVEAASDKCRSCFTKWQRLCERHPPDLGSREDFQRWTIAAHDWINRELGKPMHDNATSLQHAIFGSRYPNG